MKNIVITGSSGLAGTALLRRFEKAKEGGKNYRVLGIDIQPPRYSNYSSDSFFQHCDLDIRSSHLQDILREDRADTLIHLAWVVAPTRPEEKKEEYDIDVNGTRNALQACEKSGIENIIVASTSKHYAKNIPVPWKETDALESTENFNGYTYGRNKVIVEKMLQEYAEKHQGIRFVIFRPTHIFGPNVNNHLSRRFSDDSFLCGIRGYNPLRGFIHEDDLAEFFYQALEREIKGTFNLSAGSIRHLELLDMTSKELKKPKLCLGEKTSKFLVNLGSKLRLLEYTSSYLYTVMTDILLDTEKADAVFGKPKHSAEETFMDFLVSARKRKSQRASEKNSYKMNSRIKISDFVFLPLLNARYTLKQFYEGHIRKE